VSVKASNSGGDYPKSRPGSTSFLTVDFMADDGYESSPHVDSGTWWGCDGVVGVLLRGHGVYEDTMS